MSSANNSNNHNHCCAPGCDSIAQRVDETGYCSEECELYTARYAARDRELLENKEEGKTCRNPNCTTGITVDSQEAEENPFCTWECEREYVRQEENKQMDDKSKLKKFWMVVRTNGIHSEAGIPRVGADNAPKTTYPSFEAAKTESERLAALNIGVSFVILEAMHETKTELPPVRTKEIK